MDRKLLFINHYIFCDIDIKFGGLGAFKGNACQECLNDDFWGDSCQICPSLQLVQCVDNSKLIPGIGQCTTSCGSKTCNILTGICN